MIKNAKEGLWRIEKFYYLINRVGSQQLFIFVLTILVACQVFYSLFILNVQTNFELYNGGYQIIAQNLLNKGIYSVDGINSTAYRPPLYPLLLFSMMRLFSDRWTMAAIAIHTMLTVACGLLVFMISTDIFKNKVSSLLAGLLYITDFYFQREALAQRETILFTTLLLTFFFILFKSRTNLATYLSLSVLAALAHLTRPTGTIVFVVLLIFMYREWQRCKSQASISYAIMSILLFLFLVFPWHNYQYQKLNNLTISSSDVGGLNLFKGNNPEILRNYPFIDVDEYDPWIEQILKNKGIINEVQKDAYLKSEAVKYIKENPVGFIKASVVKLLAYYSPVPTPLGEGKLVEKDGHLILSEFRFLRKPQNLIVYFIHNLIILGGTLGFFIRWLQHKIHIPKVTYIAVIFILFTTVHTLTFGETRYRLPLDPFMIILAAIFYTSLLKDKITKKNESENSLKNNI